MVPSIPEVLFNIAAFLIDHPFFKLVAFLRIVHSVDRLFSSNLTRYDRERRTLTFPTLNPRFIGTIDASAPDAPAMSAAFATPAGEDPLIFDPQAFLVVNGIAPGDDGLVRSLDDRLLADFRDCSEEVENGDETNHVRKLLLRSACMARKGYDQTTMDYHQLKHETRV